MKMKREFFVQNLLQVLIFTLFTEDKYFTASQSSDKWSDLGTSNQPKKY